jgi:CheY-like chemotaxis protein
MPHMDGYQFIREISELPAPDGGLTPAVALSAFTRPEGRNGAINAGFQRHLSKPIEMQVLIDTLASMAGQPIH